MARSAAGPTCAGSNAGSITFTISGITGSQTDSALTTVTNASGPNFGDASVTFSIPASTSAGTYTITAAYSGSGASPASSGTATLTINKANQGALTASATSTTIAYAATTTLSTTGGSGTGTTSYAVATGAANCSISGSTLTATGVGTCTVTATKAADTNYNSLASAAITITVSKANQAIAFTNPGSKSYADVVALGGTASSGLTVSYTSSTTGVCTVSGSNATMVGVGTCTITAAQAGNTNYNAATNVAQSFTVGKANQSITFTNPGSKGYGDVVALGATASSGLTVSYTSSTTGVCTVSGSNATMVGVGTCTITAAQTGNTNYNAATNVAQSLTVGKASQTITASASPASTQYGGTSTVTGSGGLGTGAISYAATGPCSVNSTSGAVTTSGVGTCTVTATKTTDTNYLAASATANVTITQASQTITFANPGSKSYGDSFALGATASSALTVSYSSSTTGICTVSGSTATMVGVGTCTIIAAQSGNTNYSAATSVTQSFAVGKASQTITASASPASIHYGGTSTVTGSGGLGTGAISYTATAPCTVDSTSGAVTTTGVGTCTVTATKATDTNYLASTATADVTITKGSQTVTFGALANVTYSSGGTVSLGATASSGLAASYTSTTSSVCTVSSSTVSILTIGTCSITAAQAGDSNWSAATSVVQSFSVNAPALATSLDVATSTQTVAVAATAFTPVTASGGYGAVSYAISPSLPAGLSFSTSSGQISGTPTAAATSASYAVTATDSTTPTAQTSSKSFTLVVNKGAQTVTFGALANVTYSAGGTVSLGATASSALAISYTSSTSSVCTVSSSTVSILTIGTCSITAAQAGDSNWNAATSVSQSFSVNAPALATSLDVATSTQTVAVAATAFTPVSASGGYGTISYAISPSLPTGLSFSTSSGQISGTPTAAATSASYAVTATDSTTPTAQTSSKSFTLVVNKGTQTITFGALANVTYASGGTVSLAAAASSALAVSYTSSTSSVCTVSSSTVSILTIGTCSITAAQAGDSNWNAATSVSQSFSVNAPALSTTQTVASTTLTYGAAATAFTPVTGSGGYGTLSYAVSPSLPSGLVLAASSGQITGTPTTVSVATTYTVTVSDGTTPTAQTSSKTFSLTVNQASQTIAFSKPADTAFTSTPPTLGATASSNLAVSYTSSTASVCTVTAAGLITFVSAGTCTITAAQAGNTNYVAATAVSQSFSVTPGTNLITFAKPADTAFTSTPPTLGATASSNLSVTYTSSTAGVCTVTAAGVITFVSAGTCTITAAQAGNTSYAAATSVAQSFSVTPGTNVITFAKPADVTFSPGGTVALTASASSGLAVSFASTTASICTVFGSTVTHVSGGTCSITASQTGNVNYAAATPVRQSFSIGKAGQTISFSAPANIIYQAGATVPLSATASSGLAVSFASMTTSVCTVSGTNTTFAASGTCTIKASQAGNASYAAATDVSVSFGAFTAPNVTGAATVTPPSFSTPGVTLVFTFTLKNSGGVAATGLNVREARLGSIPCSSTTIGPNGGAVTCTASTVSTAADLAARSISVSPQATYSYVPPTAAVATAAAAASPATITVTVTLSVDAKVNVDVAGVQAATRSAIQNMLATRANTLTTSGPDTQRLHDRLNGGSLFGDGSPVAGLTGDDRREAPALARRAFSLGGASRLGDSGGISLGSVGNSASSSAAVANFGGGMSQGYLETVFQTPFDRFGNSQRNSGWPDSFPFAAARDGGTTTGSGDAPRQQGFRFSGSSDDGTGRFSFATSLSQMRQAALADQNAKGASGGAGAALADSSGTVKQLPIDIWVEGSSTFYKTDRIDGRRSGHAAVVSTGLDYLVQPGLLFGIMMQMDWMADNSSDVGTIKSRDGRGWMAGPYMSARLTPNVYFDARVGWGKSSNRIDPLGAYTDTFETSRILASAKLSGAWKYGDLRFRPSAELVYFSETQKDYINAIGINIASQTYNLGRLNIGPEVGYVFEFGDKSTLEPFVGVKAVWDFAKTQETTAAGESVDPGRLRGRLEGGATLRTPAGISLRASGAYDGIGTNGYKAIQGKAQITVPLQ